MATLDAGANVLALRLAKELSAACSDAKARVWKLGNAKPERVVPIGEKERLWNFSPDGQLLASVNAEQKIVVREMERGQVVQTLAGHGTWLRRVGFSPDGTKLASNGDDKTVRAWELSSGRQLWSTAGGDGETGVLIFSPDGSHLFSTNSDTDLRVWRAANGELTKKLEEFVLTMFAGQYSADGRRLVLGGADRKLTVLDTGTWRVERRIETGTELVAGLALTPDGGRAVAAGMNKDGFRLPVGVRMYDLESGRMVWSDRMSRSTSLVGVAANGKTVVWSCLDAKIEMRTLA